MAFSISREIAQIRNRGDNWLASALQRIQEHISQPPVAPTPAPSPSPSQIAPIPASKPQKIVFPTYYPFLEIGDMEAVQTPWADVRAYGTATCGAGRQAYHGSMAAGSTTLTLYSAGPLGDDTFTGDVTGFNILVSGQSGSDNAQLYTTISSFTSPIEVTLAAAAPANGLSGGINGAAVDGGGSGYSVGDTLTVVEGSDTTCTLTVTAVSGGAVTAFSITSQGSGYTLTTGLTTTGGHGSGCTITVTSINFSAEVYWWPPGQQDGLAIQNAINSGASRVYMPAGVYVVDSTNLPLTYSPTLRELAGDGTQKTVILAANADVGTSFFRFLDAHDLSMHDFSTRGSGQDGVQGGDWFFSQSIYTNSERLRFWNLEIKHSAAAQAFYLNIPILSSLRNVKIIYNAGVGLWLNGAVSCNVDDCYVLTNFGANIYLNNCYAVHLSGCAAEAGGIHYLLNNSYACSLDTCDSEQPSHQAPTAPSAAPTLNQISGGTVPSGNHIVSFTWYRQEVSGLSVLLESMESPTASINLSSTSTIGVTVPAAPTDVPSVTQVYIYVDGSKNGPYTIPSGGGTIDVTSLSGSAQGPPTYSAIGHHIIVTGGAHNGVRDCTFNSVPVIASRYVWALGDTAFLNLTNLNIITGGAAPTYLFEADSGCKAIALKSDNALSTLSDSASGTTSILSDQTIIGSLGTLTLKSGGTNQNIVITPSGSGGVVLSETTAHGVLIGEASSPITSIIGATADYPLVSNGSSADPSFKILPIDGGGTGTATPALVAGTGIGITGSWPDNTITNSLPSGGVNLQTGTSYTVVAGDAGKMVVCTNSAAFTVSLPSAATFAPDFEVTISNGSKSASGATANVTITTSTSIINPGGTSSVTLPPLTANTFWSDGTNWNIQNTAFTGFLYSTPGNDSAINYQFLMESNAPYSTPPTTGLYFSGAYNSAGNTAGFSGVGGGKENTTNGDYASFLGFYTRLNGGNTTEQIRIDPTGCALMQAGNAPCSLAPPTAANALGWKQSFFNDTYALGIASSTLAFLTGGWVSVFSGPAANNGTLTTPDTNAQVSLGADGTVRAQGFLQLTSHTISITGGVVSQNVNISNYGMVTILPSGAGASIGGFTGGVDGRLLFLSALSFTFSITNQDAGSSAVNRIYTPTGATISGISRVILEYNGSVSGWVFMSQNT